MTTAERGFHPFAVLHVLRKTILLYLIPLVQVLFERNWEALWTALVQDAVLFTVLALVSAAALHASRWRVQDDAIGPACGRLDLVDEVALVVGLEKFHFHAHLGAAQLEVIQQAVVIQLTGHTRLGEVHHVEVGAVND